jgi:hypothetical protein
MSAVDWAGVVALEKYSSQPPKARNQFASIPVLLWFNLREHPARWSTGVTQSGLRLSMGVEEMGFRPVVGWGYAGVEVTQARIRGA